jgi:FlaA1/EpsC-like NDP-sugar epimerase
MGALKNNVLGARTLVQAAEEAKVETFVVVSTDKAVRPTNVMGASKRMVENIALVSSIPNVKIVRFGNVLWSTGSVLPLFYEQLMEGRQVTLTHKSVDRYFMSVQQAVCLILQSVALVPRGVYVFDMGEPIKIKALIMQLATELGIDDYHIKEVGLRPGEKLHEELTLGEGLTRTKHSQIMFAEEPLPERETMRAGVALLESLIHRREIGASRSLLQQYVSGYVPQCGIVDDLFLHKYVVLKSQELEDCFKVPSIEPIEEKS